jgi:hypothetical protein
VPPSVPYVAQPAPTIAPAPLTAQPAYQPPFAPAPSAEAPPAVAGTQALEWYGGAQLFYDKYREPTIDLETHTAYGALTGGFDYYQGWLYTGVDARASYGQAEYESGSGELSAIPEQEYELRWKIGYNYTEDGRGFIPFTGLGIRYYQMDLKGEVTSLGALGYDRNIFQLYMPFGMRFDGPFAGWNVRSQIEADLLLYGNVSSRLGTIGGYENANNRQSFASGGGLRGEMMFAHREGGGAYYEFGPFFRYWKVGDSETDSQPLGTFLEPENDRMQVGAELRYRF